MNKFFLLLSITFTFSVGRLEAQIQTNEFPPDYNGKITSQNSHLFSTTISKPAFQHLIAEDLVNDASNEKPWRFGTAVPVNLSLLNSGKWFYDDDNGTAVWKLRIEANDALSLNLNFNQFKLSPDAKLFIYSNKSDLIGAITEKNNKKDGLFSTRPLKGNILQLELHLHQGNEAQNILSINEVVYGYRDFREKVNKVFQSSGNCNVNVNCLEGDNWKDVKRSVAMVTTSSNTRFCTGTLINNVRQDSTPYFLAAAHCGLQNNSVFIFGYESPNCNPNTDGQVINSISGSSRKAIATNFGSDFELRLLSSTPPLSYNVYYAGWSAINIPSTYSTCIHHPSGDVKKISIDKGLTTNSAYYATGVTHWQVSNWEVGTTEGGSSGAPLFDKTQRVIGQLHGGDAACGNSAQDYFGKFSYSWQTSTDTSRQLKYWLDPDNTGALVLDGLEPNTATFSDNLHLFYVDNIDDYICDSVINPIAFVRNVGNSTVTSFTVSYNLDNGTNQTVAWSGTLAKNQTTTVQIPSISFGSGNHVLTTSINFNSPKVDGNMLDNTYTSTFLANASGNPEELKVVFKTDDYGTELSWNITDRQTNQKLLSGSGYADVQGGQVFRDSICIYNACFDLNLFDTQGDGFDGQFGNGYLFVINSKNDTLVDVNTFTGSFLTDTFCITTNSTGINELPNSSTDLVVFPNPITSGNTLRVKGNHKVNLRLTDVQGKLIIQVDNSNQLQLDENITSGIYFLEIYDSESKRRLSTKKVLVQ